MCGDVTTDTEIQERILDAAEACLLESGFTARIHAAVAERAGVSRPTVYKHLGDQTAIVEALLHREMTRFFAATAPVLGHRGTPRERLIEGIVFIVGYGREHALLQKGLRDDPEVVLPYFTTRAHLVIERTVEFFTPHIREAMAELPGPTPDPRMLVEWGFRLVASLITTPSGLAGDDPHSLRRYVTCLFDLVGSPVLQPGMAATR